jgi:pimeloyl-ACP methyl ester carboxylesterase
MSNERIVQANGVELCVETFGASAHPAILLIHGAGNSMLSWENEFCERLAAGSRFVVRYDSRDCGRSVHYETGAPPYTLRDLVSDTVGLLSTFGLARAHFVGMSQGAAIGQLSALDYPDRVASLTLACSMPGGPGHENLDLPPMSEKLRAFFASTAEPDWRDRAAVIEYMVESERPFASRSRSFDEAAMRHLAGRVFDRAANIASQMKNPFLLDAGNPWRKRLGGVRAPTLVFHGTEDPLFPYEHALALSNEIPSARLIALPKTGHEYFPRAVWDIVVPNILQHTSAG